MIADRSSILALAALVPAAFNPALAASPASLSIALCGGKNTVSTVQMPLGSQPIPGDGNGMCCSKACHSANSRKRAGAKIDPVQ